MRVNLPSPPPPAFVSVRFSASALAELTPGRGLVGFKFNPRFVLAQFFHRVRRGSYRVRRGSDRVRRGSVRVGVAQLGCGVAQLGCGVAQTLAHRLIVRQARVRSR